MNNKQTEAQVLQTEMDWFYRVLSARIGNYFTKQGKAVDPLTIPCPDFAEDSYYGSLIKRLQLSAEERLIIMLALAPDIKPEFLDIFFTQNKDFDRGFTEFGGLMGKSHGGFLPTVETGFFVLTGGRIDLRLKYAHLFEIRGNLRAHYILDLDFRDKGEPFGCTGLRLNQDVLDMLILGYTRDPESGAEFPAKILTTYMEWEDLALPKKTMEQLSEVRMWLDHKDVLLNDWGLRKRLSPGYKALFYGPPGTGKTLTAALLGKLTKRDVYRVDLSQVVSKYIGETEKNLELIFRRAEDRDWILFFDEADSLFGRRTDVSDAHDRYANQGTAYLLQRIEDCPNVVLLASNLNANIDEAFRRRFQSEVYFPMPEKEERLKIWKRGFSPKSSLEEKADLEKISADYELAGGSIMNVIRFSSLKSIDRNTLEIGFEDIKAGLLKEYVKEGKLMPRK